MRSIASLLFLLVVGCGSSEDDKGKPSGTAGNSTTPTGGQSSGSGGSGGSGGSSSTGAAGKAPVVSAGGNDTTNPSVPAGTPVESVSGKAAPVVGTSRNLTPKSINGDDTPCTDIQFDPSDPTRLFAVYGTGGGIWRSEDSGQTWVQLGNMPMPNGHGRIRIDPKDPQHLYASAGVTGENWGFWTSNDGGETWVMPGAFSAGASAKKWTNDMYNLVVDPSDFNHFILSSHRGWDCCGEDAGVIESLDGGKTFIGHQPPAGMSHGNGIAFLFDEASKQGDGKTWIVGGGYGPGILRTTDAGENWKQVHAGAQDNHGGFYASYSSQGFLYVGVSGGLLRSKDNGETWEQQTGGLGGWFYGAISDGHKLYTGTAYVGVAYNQSLLVSPEGGESEGKTWTSYSDQTFTHGPFRMVFDSKNRILYSAHWDGGAWALNVGE